ncbi:GOLPH3/VPS74 family protein [Pseudonocardia sp. H11422]|uniref:GOLPH3/VPS74 family protein n=1 Tax=Pseudonocardia sp. H11422 TaxID=2835866 RepID=UPI001BDD392F|nr:GPP34 family phosphoprotein [Pseudonocardia sp. H11422]
MSRLPLAAELFLVTCHEVTGRTRIPATHLDLGLGGALLLELVLDGRIALVDRHVAVVDRTPLADPLLDRALAEVSGDPKPREPDHWVRHLARGARSAVENRLVSSGVLQVDDHRVLGLIPVHHRHQTDTRIEHELVDRLHDVVILGRPPAQEIAALVSLALAVGLEQCLFPRSDRRAIRHRMREIADGEWVGVAVRHSIDAVNAALGIETASGRAIDR